MPDIIRDRDLGVYVHAAPEGGWWAYIMGLPWCEARGETWEELYHKLLEEVEAVMESHD